MYVIIQVSLREVIFRMDLKLWIRDENGIKCPECHKIAVKLVSLNDDGTGKKICKQCKRGLRKND